MSCWRLLKLSQAPNAHVPQLLIKTEFSAKTYSVFLTDLNNIWGEELDLSGIIQRASQQESPIEVSKQDTTQLSILLDNVRKSLTNSGDTTCRITRNDTEGVILNTTTSLPEPLDSLRWKFCLSKKSSITLRNELTLPLLVSSHIQHERLNSLVTSITEKDKAITRLLDQFESNNLDLAAAFPSIGGSRPGRRLIKREQAARHVPALQPFHEDSWKQQTSQLKESDLSTLGLFQEALSQCTLKVPSQLKSEDEQKSWWTEIGDTLTSPEPSLRSVPKKMISPTTPRSELSEDETEDEFETHEHFKLRETPKKLAMAPEAMPPSAQKHQDVDQDETTDDEEDLDAPPKSQSQSHIHITARSQPSRAKFPQAKPASPGSGSAMMPKSRDFRIGGPKPKKPVVESPPRTTSSDLESERETKDDGQPNTSMPTQNKTNEDAPTSTTAKASRKPFKIGGKDRALTDKNEAGSVPHPLSKPLKTRHSYAVSSENHSVAPVPRKASTKIEVEVSSPIEEHEETPEEKAERKRLELKRRNDDLAKKQAQNKRKKRF